MRCINRCGDMVKLEKPAIFILSDYFDYIPENMQRKVPIAIVLFEVCPKCGFSVTERMTAERLRAYLKAESEGK